MRHTTFRFALAPTLAQATMLARHAGASRFAYNQCLGLVTDALASKRTDPQVRVPWSGFDLINAFNAWKRSEAAGRRFVVASDGTMPRRPGGCPGTTPASPLPVEASSMRSPASSSRPTTGSAWRTSPSPTL